MNELKIGFEMRTIRLAVDDILMIHPVKDPEKTVLRYKTILATTKAVGLVEPLVVYPQKDMPGKYLLLNGHLRLAALKELGIPTADCIIARDDECFTYNARISRLPAIQEHKMITKAVENGVSPERLSEALNMPVRVILSSLRLLDGIHEEAANLLKAKNISPKSIRWLKQVNGVRQIEIAEFMVDANNYSSSYAEALVLGTAKDQMVTPEKAKKKPGLSVEAIARMEQEMESLERDLKAVTETYTENMFTLTTAQTYIRNLLKNVKVLRYLKTNHGEICS